MSATVAAAPVAAAEGVRLAQRPNWVLATLLVTIWFAVLAFGGTERASFALVEIALAITAVVLLCRHDGSRFAIPIPVAAFLAVLVGAPLLELCPLPAFLVRWHFGKDLTGGGSFAFLSIERFATCVEFLNVLTCVLAFLLCFRLARRPQAIRRMVLGLSGLGLTEAIYGLVQYLSGWQRIFGYVKTYDLEEATGTYINRNHYAGLLEMVLPLTFALAFYELNRIPSTAHPAWSRWRRFAASPNLSSLVLWLAIAAVILAALIFSRSRMGILSACLGLFFIVFLAARPAGTGRSGTALGAVLLAAALALAMWIGTGTVLERFQTVSEEYSHGDSTRPGIWRDTLHLIALHPWLGTGLGTFPTAYTQVQTAFLNKTVNHAHNDYLELASDLGVPVAVLITLGFAFALRRAVSVYRFAPARFDRYVGLGCAGSISSILVHSLADFNLYIPANRLVFAAILGITMSLPLRRQGAAA